MALLVIGDKVDKPSLQRHLPRRAAMDAARHAHADGAARAGRARVSTSTGTTGWRPMRPGPSTCCATRSGPPAMKRCSAPTTRSTTMPWARWPRRAGTARSFWRRWSKALRPGRGKRGTQAEILHAAACYAAEHDLMWEVWELAGGIGNRGGVPCDGRSRRAPRDGRDRPPGPRPGRPGRRSHRAGIGPIGFAHLGSPDPGPRGSLAIPLERGMLAAVLGLYVAPRTHVGNSR